MRLVSALTVVAVMTVLVAVLVRGDGPNSGGTVLTFSGGHGINRNDLPVFAAWLVGTVEVVVLYVVRGPDARLRAAVVVVAMLTILLAVLLSGHGPGSVGTQFAISVRYGANLHALPYVGGWALGVLGTQVLHRSR